MNIETDLECVREWAKDKIQGGSEPPWAWYQYMKLIETLDAIIAARAASEPIHLAVDNDKIDVQLPM